MTRRIAFDSVPQLEPAEGVRGKEVVRNGRRIRVVEFAAGFREAEWCHKGHLGYVLAGQLEIEFTDAVEVFSVGDALMIPMDDKHRTRVIDGPVRLFLVEEA